MSENTSFYACMTWISLLSQIKMYFKLFFHIFIIFHYRVHPGDMMASLELHCFICAAAVPSRINENLVQRLRTVLEVGGETAGLEAVYLCAPCNVKLTQIEELIAELQKIYRSREQQTDILRVRVVQNINIIGLELQGNRCVLGEVESDLSNISRYFVLFIN